MAQAQDRRGEARSQEIAQGPMRSAKEIVVHPIAAVVANEFIKRVHYSGTVVRNSQLHFGVYLDKRLEGVIQLGPSMDKRKVSGLVTGTKWDEFIEINRLAFTDYLPRNSESRALAVVIRTIRKRYPRIKWIISYADACQCGDGTIYRAAGFLLTDIKRNYNVRRAPDGTAKVLNGRWDYRGTEKLKGFQLRYIFFVDAEARFRLVPEVIAFSEISERGASMARGQFAGASSEEPRYPLGQDGSNPIPPLHIQTRKNNETQGGAPAGIDAAQSGASGRSILGRIVRSVRGLYGR